MSQRPIEMIFAGPKRHWVGNGFHVSNYFPRGARLFERFSPFILLDYNMPYDFAPATSPRGIGAHPHRGFETVTFAFEGAVEHHDNQGNHGIIYPGDVQWMTAGSGILHKEYHEKKFSSQGGTFHMIQLWVNLPAKDKMTTPGYQALEASDMGLFELPEDSGKVHVVAGNFKDVKGPAKTFSPINIYRVEMKEGAELTLDEPATFNTGLLVIEGDFEINGQTVKEHDFVLFENVPGEISLKALSEKTQCMVFSGEDLKEPIAAGGPFVMNTREELQQANEDFHMGKFGSLDF